MGHDCIDHDYMRHNYVGHKNYIGHNGTGHNYVGHNVMGHNYIGQYYTGHNWPCRPTRCVCGHACRHERCMWHGRWRMGDGLARAATGESVDDSPNLSNQTHRGPLPPAPLAPSRTPDSEKRLSYFPTCGGADEPSYTGH